jgi:hypothetical protein
MILILSLYGLNKKGFPLDFLMQLPINHFIREMKGIQFRIKPFNPESSYPHKPLMQTSRETTGVDKPVGQIRLESFQL